MNKQRLDGILKQIAQENHTTPEQVRSDMEYALEAGWSSPDPAVQARWKLIPHKGEKVTLEEFLEYAVGILRQGS